MRKKRSDGPMTAEEFTRLLENDPEYQGRIAEKEAARLEAAGQNREDAAPILAELAGVGIEVQSIDDLYNEPVRYRDAIPLLIRWVPRIENPDVKAALVRALSVKWAKPDAAPMLVEEFRRIPESRDALRWVIANALEVVADDSVFEDIARLARDRRYGKSREMLAVALGNMHVPEAVEVLLNLLEDEEIAGHAVIGLGKLKDPRARDAIKRFSTHPKAWIRREAKRALAKMDRLPD